MSAKEYSRDPTIRYIHTNFPKTLSSTHRTTCRHAYWQPYSTVLTATPIVFRFSALKPGSHSRTGSEPLSFLKKEAGNRFISLAFICTFFGASVNVLQITFNRRRSESDHQAGEGRSMARTETGRPVDQRDCATDRHGPENGSLTFGPGPHGQNRSVYGSSPKASWPPFAAFEALLAKHNDVAAIIVEPL